MALPKKKISVSRKKIRFSSFKLKPKTYIRYDKCSHYILPHRSWGSKDVLNHPTNISKKYNLETL
jgi:ribosomal protein L32